MAQAQRIKPVSGDEIDLSGAVIPFSDLSETQLSGANFEKKTLCDANFAGADLSHARFSGADLRRANLSNTNLSYADFSKADLTAVDLSAANFMSTNLDGAKFDKTKLQGADLRHAHNALWEQLLDAFIDEHTTLPEDLSIDALHETLEGYIQGFDLRADFEEVYDDMAILLLKLTEIAGDRTIGEFAVDVGRALMIKEFQRELNPAGLNDEPDEYKDE